MNATKNPLAVMADAILLMQVSGYALSANDTRAARAAVAELVEAAKYVYQTRFDGEEFDDCEIEVTEEFCSEECSEHGCMRMKGDSLRAALAKFGGGV